MLRIVERSRVPFYLIATVLVVIALTFVLVRLTMTAYAAPATITVTTTVDEDVNPGTGCSIYEASVAANTGAAYGGCAAGSLVDGSVISIPAGVYAQTRNTEEAVFIELNNVSVQGTGVDTTILRAYSFLVTGDEAASIGDLTLSNIPDNSDADPSFTIEINGSNKTVDTVKATSNHQGIGAFAIAIAAAEEPVTNTSILNIDAQTGMSYTGIEYVGPLDDVVTTFDNITLAADNTTVSTRNSPGASISNITMTSGQYGGLLMSGETEASSIVQTTPEGSDAYIEIDAEGEESILSGVTQTNDLGSVEIDGSYASVDGVESSGKYVFYYTDADVMSNVLGTSTEGSYVYNYAEGSDISYVDLHVTEQGGAYLYVEPAKVNGVSAQGMSGSYFYSNYEGTEINGLDMTATDEGSNVSISTNASAMSNVTIDSAGTSSISNNHEGGSLEGLLVNAHGHSLDSKATTISDITIDVTDGQSLYVNFPQLDSTITDVDIDFDTSSSNSAVVSANASSIQNFSMNARGEANLVFSHSQDDATISNLSLVSETTNSSSFTASFNGDNLQLENSSLVAGGQSYSVAFSGQNPDLSNVEIENNMTTFSGEGDVTIRNVSTIGSPVFGFQFQGLIEDVIVEDSYIADVGLAGIMISAAPSETQSFLIDNVVIDDVHSYSSPGAVFVSSGNNVDIRNSTIKNSTITGDSGIVSFSGGTGHKVTNTTFANNNAGIALLNTGSPIEVEVNNVTILNDANDEDYNNHTDNSVIRIAGSEEATSILNIKNSIIAGTSPYTECIVTDGELNISDTLSNDESCLGAIEIDELEPLTTSILADNNSSRVALGYKGTQGKVQTFALPLESQALMLGDTTTCELDDARGIVRDLEYGCDVGSFQLSAPVVVDPDPDPDPNPDPDPTPDPDPDPTPTPDPDPTPNQPETPSTPDTNGGKKESTDNTTVANNGNGGTTPTVPNTDQADTDIDIPEPNTPEVQTPISETDDGTPAQGNEETNTSNPLPFIVGGGIVALIVVTTGVILVRRGSSGV